MRLWWWLEEGEGSNATGPGSVWRGRRERTQADPEVAGTTSGEPTMNGGVERNIRPRIGAETPDYEGRHGYVLRPESPTTSHTYHHQIPPSHCRGSRLRVAWTEIKTYYYCNLCDGTDYSDQCRNSKLETITVHTLHTRWILPNVLGGLAESPTADRSLGVRVQRDRLRFLPHVEVPLGFGKTLQATQQTYHPGNHPGYR